jgi:hypothetical protein
LTVRHRRRPDVRRGACPFFEESGMTIPDHVERNFKTLGRAAQSGTLGMIACIDPATGAIRFLLCAVAPSSSGIPGIVFAELLDRDPFDTLPPVAAMPGSCR